MEVEVGGLEVVTRGGAEAAGARGRGRGLGIGAGLGRGLEPATGADPRVASAQSAPESAAAVTVRLAGPRLTPVLLGV